MHLKCFDLNPQILRNAKHRGCTWPARGCTACAASPTSATRFRTYLQGNHRVSLAAMWGGDPQTLQLCAEPLELVLALTAASEVVRVRRIHA